MDRHKTIVYVDGFNLYYGKCKGTDGKWLNLEALFQRLLPQNHIVGIKYFTARVRPSSTNPNVGARQQLYLRALKTIPNLEIIYGHFLRHEKSMPRADGSGNVRVLKTEEKGSDVNLASHLLIDAYEGNFDAAAVCSNDSDLAFPIETVKVKLNKPVGFINPQRNPSNVLRASCTFMKRIRTSDIINSQFPASLSDSRGSFTKPSEW